MDINEYINVPKRYKAQPGIKWTKKEWLQMAWIMSHSPWVTEIERDYWKKKITDLTE